MEENQVPVQPETNDKPKTQAPENPIPDKNKLLIKAQCEEDEGQYQAARDHFIELDKADEARRCSGKLFQQEEERNKRNRRNIFKLAWASGIVIIAFLISLIWLNNEQRNATSPSVPWLNAGNVELNSYPSWFFYDKKVKLIKTRAIID